MRKIALSFIMILGSFASAAIANDGNWNPNTPMPHDIVVGNPEAPITVVEYASLTCPHCGRFHRETMPDFQKQLLETGKAKLVYRHLPLDQSALAGALAASCSPEDIKFDVVSTLFGDVSNWAADITKIIPLLQSRYGDKINADELVKCVSSSALANEIVTGMQKAIDGGVASTPTFYVNGEKFEGFIAPENFIPIVSGAK